MFHFEQATLSDLHLRNHLLHPGKRSYKKEPVAAAGVSGGGGRGEARPATSASTVDRRRPERPERRRICYARAPLCFARAHRPPHPPTRVPLRSPSHPFRGSVGDRQFWSLPFLSQELLYTYILGKGSRR